MDNGYEYVDNFMSREFYETYKRVRRQPSKTVNQYKYFEKAFNGMIRELRVMIAEHEKETHLKGIGVIYKEHTSDVKVKVSILEHRTISKNTPKIRFESQELQEAIFTRDPPKLKMKLEKCDSNPEAVLIHRKLKLKK